MTTFWIRQRISRLLIRMAVAAMPCRVRPLFRFICAMGVAWLDNDDLVKKSQGNEPFSFTVEVTPCDLAKDAT